MGHKADLHDLFSKTIFVKAESSPEKNDFLKSIIISLSIKRDISGLHEHRVLHKWEILHKGGPPQTEDLGKA